jgi:hypothetical protein
MVDLFMQASRSDVIPLSTIYIIKQEFNTKFPGIHTTHLYPGAVAMTLFKHPTVPWYIQVLTRVIFIVLARSPAKYADVAIWEITNCDFRSSVSSKFKFMAKVVTAFGK